MTKLLGANWRTSVTGLAETTCLIILAVVALPVDWSSPKAWIPLVLGVIAKTVKDFLTKDKNITGGAIQQNAAGEVTGIAKTVAPAIRT